jgi:hypothetical protein
MTVPEVLLIRAAIIGELIDFLKLLPTKAQTMAAPKIAITTASIICAL